MNLLKAYFDGWRVLLRVLAFTLCMSLVALPVVLAVCIFLRLGDCPATQALLTTAVLLYLPIAAYLASWYAGEFRQRAGEAQESEELAGLDEM